MCPEPPIMKCDCQASLADYVDRPPRAEQCDIIPGTSQKTTEQCSRGTGPEDKHAGRVSDLSHCAGIG